MASRKSLVQVDRQFQFGAPPNFELQNRAQGFPTNFIKTSRYTLITFLPLSLFYQFTRLANLYFLLIAILQCIPIISPLSPFSAIAPLVFVVSLSMVREGYEDYIRHKSDEEMNSSNAKIRTLTGADGFQVKQWKDVQVGDIVWVEDHEIISVDLIVIATSLPTGQCFIETSSLDGEKNLKPKSAVSETHELILQQQTEKPLIKEDFSGRVQCMLPNALLYTFDGVLYWNEKKYSLNHRNLLLRGSRLKNVKWAIGITVYTGLDTKVMRNSDEAKPKMSNIDKLVNQHILYILGIQIGCCVVLSIIFSIRCFEDSLNYQYFNPDYNCALSGFLVFCTYFLLMNTMIPISLIVSLEFVKVAQAYFMEKDKEMYTEDNDKHLKVFSTTINEELGQVQYIFSDKTGTLTCNKMEFKLVVVGEQTYGDLSIFSPQEITTFVQNQILRQQKNNKLSRKSTFTDNKAGIDYNFESNKIEDILKEKNPVKNPELNFAFLDPDNRNLYTIERQSDLVKEVMMLLACCHECVLEKLEDDDFRYQGPSPDEIALVDAARRMNFVFKGMNMNNMCLEVDGSPVEVELLKSFEFNSDRKRMSVIIRHNGVIKIYTKGADSIVKSRLSNKNQPFLKITNDRLDFFAKKGLRTLCLAMRVLSEQEYAAFEKKMNDCLGQDNQEKIQEEFINQIETELMLLGLTAVEDKLQEDVPETLADFLKANINVWMLTGDKLETAENIGRSCNLIQDSMELFYITPDVEPMKVFNNITDHINKGTNQKRALIIEGIALINLQRKEEELKYLVTLASQLHSVICCRVTPKQKADMVRLVKAKLGKITLAVGDGANDVNMILEANIGVGIYGQEGMRAVQSSNYAIGQFKCLWKLILYHGRMNYIRISEMILYFFYKNIIFTIPQFFFAFFNAYSGQSIFDDFYITLYNTVFTFWPVVIKAIFDEDLYYTRVKRSTMVGSRRLSIAAAEARAKNDILKQHYPKLYYIGQRNTIFTTSRFFKWFGIGALQGLVCFFVIAIDLKKDVILTEGGYNSDLWFVSITIFTAIMILVTLKLALNTQFWTIITWVAYIGTSLGTYFTYVFIAGLIPASNTYKTVGMVFNSSQFYLNVCLSVLGMFVIDLLLFTFKTSKNTLLNYFKQAARTESDFDIEKIHQLNLKLENELKDEQEMATIKELNIMKKEFQLNQSINNQSETLNSSRNTNLDSSLVQQNSNVEL